MKKSMAHLTPHFSTNRMLREYVEKLYLPGINAYHNRIAEDCRQAILIRHWRESLSTHWKQLRFGQLAVQEVNNYYNFSVPVYLGELDPDSVHVQLYAESQGNADPNIWLMERGKALAGTANDYIYTAKVPAERPSNDYTPRVIPFFNGVAVPLEAAQILWYK